MSVYEKVMEFKNKYSSTMAFRIKKHCKIIEEHLNPNEEVCYAFTGQKNQKSYDIISTYVLVLTNKRLLVARKRLLFGYFFHSITPDLFNDIKVKSNIIWGRVKIDTVKEVVYISNISKKALKEIETEVTEHMMNNKKKYIGKKGNE